VRILLVTTFFPNSVNRHRAVFMENLARALRKRCAVRVVAPVPYAPPIPQVPRWFAQRRIPRREILDGMEVLHPRFIVLPKLGWFSGFGYFLGVFRLLRRLLRGRRPYLVHAHCVYPDGVGVALVARLLRLPYVITAHGSDLNIYAARALLKPQVRWALRGAAGVIAVSDALKEKVRVLTEGSVKRLECIPCAGFDPATFFPRSVAECRAALNLPADARIVLFVGNLVPIKGLEFLIDAWALLGKSGLLCAADRLVLIGAGPLRANLESRAEAGAIAAQVRFAGAMRQAEVSGWLGAADLLCLSSLNEGMPNVVVEALASGVPVVATRVGGVPELVIEGVNGMLVPARSSEALADALAAALARTWERAPIGASVAHLTWQAIAMRNCEFLAGSVGSGNSLWPLQVAGSSRK
jgi:teichuronic acid biosynthesis glycosyltransferase TuaC